MFTYQPQEGSLKGVDVRGLPSKDGFTTALVAAVVVG